MVPNSVFARSGLGLAFETVDHGMHVSLRSQGVPQYLHSLILIRCGKGNDFCYESKCEGRLGS